MKSKGELVLVIAVAAFAFALAMMFPQVRHAVFGGAVPAPARVFQDMTGAPIEVEKPRNQFPMAQYTAPQLFKKMRFAVTDDSGGRRIVYYYWYAPPAAVQAGRRLPLVVVLHDAQGMDYAAISLRLHRVQQQFPSFLLIPQSPPGKVWDAPKKWMGKEFPQGAGAPVVPEEAKSLPDVIRLMAQLTVQYPIDESRLYVIGCDEGGTGVYGAAADFPGVFAGGVALEGRWSFLDGAKLAKTPLLILQGDKDAVVTPEFGSTMQQILQLEKANVGYYVFQGLGHDCSSANFYSDAVWKWLFAQRRAPVPAPAPAAPAAP